MSEPFIKLEPAEKLLQQTLLDCQAQLRQPLDIRFAGGWVRDKLLGIPSHDIDVALSSMTGYQFGEALKDFLDQHGAKYSVEAEKLRVKADLSSLHQIMAQPDKSKHLETITTKMFGLDLDFVNLRKETYSDDTRNPQMEFGSPEEDAVRRDATINALFYNITTQSVEDYTRQGLSDMANHIIRTPLPPYQTFEDDPLRVLRLIRFACRLGYRIDDESFQAMKERTIHHALRKKISRERVGVELGKMLRGPNPYRASFMINELGLYPSVFACLPDDKVVPDLQGLPSALGGLRRIEKERQRANEQLNCRTNADDQALSYLLANYAPWHQCAVEASVAIREAIKGDKGEKRMNNILCASIKNREDFRNIIDQTLSGLASRADIGMALYHFGPTWRYQLLYSLFCEFLTEGFENASSRFANFLKIVREKDLEGAAELKPIIDGNAIKEALNRDSGKWMTVALETVRSWQFEHPDGTKDDAIEMIMKVKEKFEKG